MGAGATVNKKPQCPHNRLVERKIREAKRMSYIDGEASEFYFFCENGNIDQVRKILEAPDCKPIDELVKLEPNGNTALHIATEKGHAEIAKLLLKHRCSRIILNRFGRVAAEEAATPEMQKLFIRSENSDRFHESDTNKTMRVYFQEDDEKDSKIKKSNENSKDATALNNKPAATTSGSLQFVEHFEKEEDVQKYTLDYQTTAMWLKIYNWFSRTFPNFFRRDNLQLEAFELHNNEDFKHFLKKKFGADYEEVLKIFNNAKDENSIEPFITIYTNENTKFYSLLNRQLADSPAEADNSPHLCDRYIIEFHIRADELESRSFIGKAYRGATMNLGDLSVYEKARSPESCGIVVFNAFTSTSEDIEVALGFIMQNPPKANQIGVLFVIETKVKSPTVLGVSDVSEFKNEKEVLFLPGNLFRVNNIKQDVSHTINATNISVTEVHLEYVHMEVSIGKKILHTIRSAKNSVTHSEDHKRHRR